MPERYRLAYLYIHLTSPPSHRDNFFSTLSIPIDFHSISLTNILQLHEPLAKPGSDFLFIQNLTRLYLDLCLEKDGLKGNKLLKELSKEKRPLFIFKT